MSNSLLTVVFIAWRYLFEFRKIIFSFSVFNVKKICWRDYLVSFDRFSTQIPVSNMHRSSFLFSDFGRVETSLVPTISFSLGG